MNPEFLDVEDVIEIHEVQLAEFGGAGGIRDLGLLESALAQPMACIGGEFLHDSLFAMAAAYLFHIVMNHPFVDGNKRAGLASALTFLDVNGFSVNEAFDDELHEATIAVSNGTMDKSQLLDLLMRISTPKPSAE